MEDQIFRHNRERIIRLVDDNSLVIVYAGRAALSPQQQSYPFEPDRNFFYLTGLREEDAILLLGKSGIHFVEKLFIPRRDLRSIQYNGEGASFAQMSEQSGIEDIVYLDEIDLWLRRAVAISFAGWPGIVEQIYLDLRMLSPGEGDSLEYREAKRLGAMFPSLRIRNAMPLFHELRYEKSDWELTQIRDAIDITWLGIQNILEHVRPGMTEHEIRALFEVVLLSRGLTTAFPTIVSSGEKSCIVHHAPSARRVGEGDLFQLDLGAQNRNYYAADISRVFPINGRFSQRQKDIYSLVLEAQSIAFDMAKPGVIHKDVEERIMCHYGKGLKKLGLLEDADDMDGVRQYHLHGIGHPLGLVVHDVCTDYVFRENCVYTIEPALYIPEWGFGIRIEDIIVIKSQGCEILSSMIPRTVEDIESLFN